MCVCRKTGKLREKNDYGEQYFCVVLKFHVFGWANEIDVIPIEIHSVRSELMILKGLRDNDRNI